MNSSSWSIRWPQFGLRSLLVFVAFLAFGLTALKLATHSWCVVVTTVTVGSLLFAIFRCIHSRDAVRAYWSSFAICVGGYLALVWVLSTNSLARDITGRDPVTGHAAGHTNTVNDLPTTAALDFLFRKFNPLIEHFLPGDTSQVVFGAIVIDTEPTEPTDTFDIMWTMPDGKIAHKTSNTSNFATSESSPFLLSKRMHYFPRIGHALFALLLGWICAAFVSSFATPVPATAVSTPCEPSGQDERAANYREMQSQRS